MNLFRGIKVVLPSEGISPKLRKKHFARPFELLGEESVLVNLEPLCT